MPCFIVIHVLLPAYLTAGIIYCKGGLQAFCIGALFPAALMYMIIGWHVGYSVLEGRASVWGPARLLEYFERTHFQFRLFALGTWMTAIVSGAMVVAFRDRATASGEINAES